MQNVKGKVKGKVKGNISAIKSFGVGALGAIGNVIALIAVLASLYTAWDAVYRVQNKAYFDREKIKQTEEQIKAYQDYIDKLDKVREADKNATDSQVSNAKAKEELLKASENLRKAIGDEAYTRIMASGDIKQAMQAELKALIQVDKVRKQKTLNAINLSIKQSEEEAKQVRQRIALMETELDALKQSMRTRMEIMQSAIGGWNIKNPIAKKFFAKAFGISDEIEQMDSLQYDIDNATKKLQGINTKLTEARLARDKLSGEVNIDLGGNGNGETSDDDSKPNRNPSTNYNANNAEQFQRNVLQARRNELWYEGSIQAKKYENSLKDITNDEQYYGTTVASIIAKSSLYGERSKELEDYKTKLEKFRTDLENELDAKMKASPQLAQLAKYTIGLKGEELEKNIEVNKEVYQQSKTVSNIINLISAVNQKLEETKTKSIDIANEQRKIADEISKQKISDIEQQASIDIARINRPTNFDYNKQKNQIELEEYKAILLEKEQVHEQTLASMRKAQSEHDEQILAGLRKKSQTEIQSIEETKAKVAELENEKTATIRQGLYDVTQQFLIQGNSLKDIWNNLWKDLAREALQRLFQIQAQASILGSLFGWSGGGKTATVTAGNYNFGKSFGYSDFKLSHTGENLSGYPKMHTGGMVQQGRLGVVPKLKSDEVVRTLQIGEEVNSVSDRRSNEILATVAMKAIDSRNQQPNNINIMAIDSRSFAEYLNDNADVLLAVLNKQGALGRR